MTPAEERTAKLEVELNDLDPDLRGQVWNILAANQRAIGDATREGRQPPERMSVADARAQVGRGNA
jgi:hypothetical protein